MFDGYVVGLLALLARGVLTEWPGTTFIGNAKSRLGRVKAALFATLRAAELDLPRT